MLNNGINSEIIKKPENLFGASKIILPGVGHFKKGMDSLIKHGFVDVLNELVLKNKVPILGICLGMQLMTKRSDEGNVQGLGWLNAETLSFRTHISNEKVKIPHVGWKPLSVKKKCYILSNDSDSKNYYFTHSYFVTSDIKEQVVAFSNYEGIDFISIIKK